LVLGEKPSKFRTNAYTHRVFGESGEVPQAGEGAGQMKLSDIEDADRLVTRDQLEVALGRLENHVDERFNSLDARINRVERSVWFLVIAAVIQVLAIFGPVVVKMVLKQ
jgi:hypothetical protein